MIITVATMKEAIRRAMKLSVMYPVLIRENEYESDKAFKGVIIHVKKSV